MTEINKNRVQSQSHIYQIRGWLHFYSKETRIDLVQAKLGECKVEFFDENRSTPIDRWVIDDTNLLVGGEEKFFLFIGAETTIHSFRPWLHLLLKTFPTTEGRIDVQCNSHTRRFSAYSETWLIADGAIQGNHLIESWCHGTNLVRHIEEQKNRKTKNA